MVTDRRRLATVFDRPEADSVALLLRQIEGAVAGGVDLVQIREKDLEAGALARIVREALQIARGSSTQLVVNDRLDVALACGADGVHLGEVSVAVADARRIGGSWLVGRSVHAVGSAVSASRADYLIAGTVFGSSSKPPTATLIGQSGLASIARAAGSTPVLAIGGVTPNRLAAVLRAGAVGVAAIGAFLPSAADDDVVSAVQKRSNALRLAFDSASTVF